MTTTVAFVVAALVEMVVILAWPNRAVRHHRVSNWFFLRRLRRQQAWSRTPDGSTSSGDMNPQWSPETAGVERRVEPAAPPATPTLVGAIDPRTGTAPTRPQTPVNIGRHPGRRSPASTSVGAGAGHHSGSLAPTGPAQARVHG